MHLLGRAPEQSPAAGGEQGVAAEEQATADVGHVPGGVTRDIERVELQIEFGQRDAIAFLERVRQAGNALARRAVHRDGIMPENILHAAHVIAVMMGAEDGKGFQALLFQRRQHRTGVAGVHDGNMARRFAADQPDIVVLEGEGV